MSWLCVYQPDGEESGMPDGPAALVIAIAEMRGRKRFGRFGSRTAWTDDRARRRRREHSLRGPGGEEKRIDPADLA